MEKKQEKKRYRLTKASYIVWILAGIYLLYLVYQMVTGWVSCTGFTLVASVVGMVAFTIIGVGLISYGIYALQTGRYAGGKMDLPEENAED